MINVDPPPVFRVVDSKFRGVPNVAVTATLSVASGPGGAYVNVTPYTGSPCLLTCVLFDLDACLYML